MHTDHGGHWAGQVLCFHTMVSLFFPEKNEKTMPSHLPFPFTPFPLFANAM